MTLSGADGRRRSPRARLAVGGHDPDRAIRLLAPAGLWPSADDVPVDDPRHDDVPDATWQLVEAASFVGSPDDALLALTQLATDHPDTFLDLVDDPEWLARAVAVAGTSRPLGLLLAQHPAALRAVQRPGRVDPDQISEVVRLAVQTESPDDHPDRQAWVQAAARAVATIRRHVTAAIASRDLTGQAPVDVVAADLANLAEGVLDGTLAAVHAALAGEAPAAVLAVIGMGKLGGQELNYVSDVDVVYVHAPAAAADGDDEAAAREAEQVLTAVMAILNASTTMGRAYEIDPTLRPEGRQGALSRTIEGYEAYWDRWAKTWEFQALVKARPVAGDEDLGRAFVEAAHRRVWPDELDPEVVGEIRRMKARVESKPEVRRDGDRQVKLGPGGLRDIEFAVQLLQLVHGRHDRRLRLTGTLPTLTALASGGYVADEDASAFADAYRHLRRVEHRLQLANERRTHTIPTGDDRQEWLARSLGYTATPEAPARVAFARDLRSWQATVRDLHAKLFYRPLLEAHAAVPAGDGQLSLPGQVSVMGVDAAHERLRVLGYTDPVASLRHIEALTSGVSRRARALRAVLPAMLHDLAATADPDGGLHRFRAAVDGHGHSAPLALRLRDHPPAAELLARILGASPVAGDLFAALPSSVDWLTDEELRSVARDRDGIVRLLSARLGWQDRDAALRRIKRQELLRVVLRDLGGWTDQQGVAQELTALGEACLEVGLRAVVESRAEELGHDTPPARIALIGMGKLGGEELHYCSDLDVLFVHEAAPGADAQVASRFATQVATHLLQSLGAITAEGTAFEIDADLRPEGRSGPLSRSLDAYRRYYADWSAVWEHQALLRARPVAGDEDLGQRFAQEVATQAVPDVFDESMAREIRKLKARLERERVPKRADPSRHLKMGPGGLADIEWTVQLLQMRHGRDRPELLTPSTPRAIEALVGAGVLEPEDASVLAEGLAFLTLVRNRLYLRRERTVDELPRQGSPTLRVLAEVAGHPEGGWQEFEAEHARHRRRVRRVCERVFYEMDAG